MNNNMVENPKKEVPANINMNDRDYLTDIVNTEKQISNNLSTALSEASNEQLYNQLLPMFTDTKEAGRESFDLLFKNGWYPLETAEQQKIQQKLTDLQTKFNELSQ
ncbi:MAG: spore coat protein [Bacilli bacterium]